jgi:hypothetical protein
MEQPSKEPICNLALADHNNRLYSTRGFSFADAGREFIIREWELKHTFG